MRFRKRKTRNGEPDESASLSQNLSPRTVDSRAVRLPLDDLIYGLVRPVQENCARQTRSPGQTGLILQRQSRRCQLSRVALDRIAHDHDHHHAQQ
jgi:hypothetical protein